MKLLTKLVATLMIALMPILAFSPITYATSPSCGTPSNAKTQVLSGIGDTGGNCDGSGVTNIIGTVVKILGIIVGAAAIIMILVSGFRYITSAGDSNRISSAKNTLIYALIGLAVAVLAQVLVNFVIQQSNSAGQAQTCPQGQHLDASNNCVK